MVNFVFLHKFLRGFFYRLLFLKMPVPVFWSREDVKALIVVWKDEKIQEQIGSGKKRNTHVHRRIFLSISSPQLTTNLELTPKLCGQELRLPIAIVIRMRIQIKMALPCKRNSRLGSRSGSTYPDRPIRIDLSGSTYSALNFSELQFNNQGWVDLSAWDSKRVIRSFESNQEW